jgi:hypothetical protein
MLTDFGTMRSIAGATYPNTELIWMLNGDYVDGTAFTTFNIECNNAATGAAGFADKSTGVTTAAGDADTPSFTIAWTNTDLGSLAAGTYRLEYSRRSGRWSSSPSNDPPPL